VEEKKTHRLVAKPQMSVRSLADYMAASDQARRTVVRGCKYRAIAKIVQHDDAKLTIAKYMLGGGGDPEILTAAAEFIRNKLADDDFDAECNEHNADYIARFAKVVENVELPKGAELEASKQFAAQNLNGVKVTFTPSLLVRRATKKNTLKTGALMLRYKKGAKLNPEVAAYQSSAIHGVLCLYGVPQDVEVDRALSFTLDAYSGTLYPAPGNAVSRFNNIKAACATIAEAWDNIQPPAGAVL
jgi:hypothetical protein